MDGQRITLRRSYATARRRVFDAWTRPPLLRRWAFGRHHFGTKSVRLDLFVGGRIELIKRGAGASRRWGTFREVHAPGHLQFTWASDDLSLPSEMSRVTVDIEGNEHESTLTLTQEGLPDAESCEQSRALWEELLESLEAFLLDPSGT